MTTTMPTLEDLVPGFVESGQGGDLPPNIIEQTFFEYVPLDKMFVDYSYARQFKPAAAARIRTKWNPKKVSPILLSYRADYDSYAILDGQHRVAVARLEGLVHLPAYIYIDLTHEQEADYYQAFATRMNQSALDKFRSRIESRDKDALKIREALLRHGLDVAIRGKGPGKVEAVDKLDAIHRQHGAEFLAEMVGVLHDAWGLEPRAWIGRTLHGMAMFWVRYRRVADRTRLLDRMKVLAPEVVIRESTTYQTNTIQAPAGWGKALRRLYNQGLRTNLLPEWPEKIGQER